MRVMRSMSRKMTIVRWKRTISPDAGGDMILTPNGQLAAAAQPAFGGSGFSFGGGFGAVSGVPNAAGIATATFMAITKMEHYEGYSFEELRVQDYRAGCGPRSNASLSQIFSEAAALSAQKKQASADNVSASSSGGVCQKCGITIDRNVHDKFFQCSGWNVHPEAWKSDAGADGSAPSFISASSPTSMGFCCNCSPARFLVHCGHCRARLPEGHFRALLETDAARQQAFEASAAKSVTPSRCSKK